MKQIVVTHHNADLDALASVVAACVLYGATGAIGVHGGTVSLAVQRYLAVHKDLFHLVPLSEIDASQVEEVIVVDVRDRTRLLEYGAIFANNPRIIVYDHHPVSPDDLVADQEIIEPVGACTTILCERIQEQNLPFSRAAATLMLLGIYADTGNLTYSSTTARDVDVAAFLLRSGANLTVVSRYLEQQYTVAQRQLLVTMIPSTEQMCVDGVDMAYASAKTTGFVKGASEIVERLMKMSGHAAMFGVMEFTRSRRTQIIARSQVGHVDVGALMQQLGGGGHSGAGAATFKDESLEIVLERLIALLKETKFRPPRVRDIMSSPVQTVDHDTTLGQAGTLLQRWNVSGVPVMREGEMRGIVSRRDVERARLGGSLELPISAFMSHEIVTASDSTTLEDALDLLTNNDIGRLPVLEDGRLIGIVTRSDLIGYLYEE